MKTRESTAPSLDTLPGDEVRQIMWGYADRYDLQMVVQSVRSVARGVVARLVAGGGRHSHEWTEDKAALLPAFDEAGITALYMDPEDGGYIAGPKNLALALTAFELAWVDGGAATCSMAGHLALAPVHERGTPEQKREYMTRCVPPPPDDPRTIDRGAFCLTEPLPYVGVETGVLSGTVRVESWEDGKEPLLLVEKRGRFITNMGFATFVTAAVRSADERIRGTCMILLEESDPGTFDRGVPTRKMVHQLSSTTDPIFRLTVPAGRIVGGYTVQDGVIVPNHDHAEIIEAVFRRTRVTVGSMTAAKLLSAVEPVIRYHRTRFRGGAGQPGTPRHDLGLQQREDVLHRLLDVWAAGEASAALGFATARLLDEYDVAEAQRDEGVVRTNGRARDAARKAREPALELLRLARRPEDDRDPERFRQLAEDPAARFAILEAATNVLCPACKLWNTGHGAQMMREAVSLMGGYGITEDCPGFLGQKWMDAQLEATYEGPEAVQRRQLAVTMTDEVFLEQMRVWVGEMRHVASERPGTGACTLATAMELWLWTLQHLLTSTDADGRRLYRGSRQGVSFPMADALCWLLAARYLVRSVIDLENGGQEAPGLQPALPGYVAFFTDLAHVFAAQTAGEVGRICAELVFGYGRHPSWEGTCTTCYTASEISALEGVMPGIAAGVRGIGDVLESDGSHASKAGPCASFAGMEDFMHLRKRMDACLTGARLAKDRAADALTSAVIPEALDYPAAG